MQKKFYLGLAVLLGVSLFVTGCAPEPEEKIVKVPEYIRYDAVVGTEADFVKALADSAVRSIEVKSALVLTAVEKIPEGKFVMLIGKLTPRTIGLTIEGTVQVGQTGELVAAFATPVSVKGTGSISVLKGGTLTVASKLDLNSGERVLETVLGNEEKVSILGTLKLTTAPTNLAALTEAFGWIRDGATLNAGTANALTLKEIVEFSLGGKKLEITSSESSSMPDATLLIPAGLTFSTAHLLAAVTDLTVYGHLTTTGASTGASAGVAVTVKAGGMAELAEITKAKASTVEVDGTLTATITDFVEGAALTVQNNAIVNGIRFPAATEVSEVTDDGVTVSQGFDVTQPWLLGGDLILAKGAYINVNADVTLGTGSLTLTAGTALGDEEGVADLDPAADGALLSGTANLIAGSTKFAFSNSTTGVPFGWQAVGTGTVAIAVANIYAATITASADTAVLTARGSASTITQGTGYGNNLTVTITSAAENKTAIDFGSGALILAKQTESEVVATVTVLEYSVLAFGTLVVGALDNSALTTALVAVGVTAASDLTGKAVAAEASTLTQIIGASANNTLTGPVSSDDTNSHTGKIDGTVVATGS
jgi:hypothetical protein